MPLSSSNLLAASPATASELADVLDAVGVGSWSYDLVSGAIAWSPGVCALFGVDAPPATYDAYLERIHPDDRAALGARVRAAVDAGTDAPYHVLHRVVRPDGTVRWSMGRGRVTRDPGTGAPRSLVGVSWDVTEREEARLRAEALARRLTLLVGVSDAFAEAEGWEEPLRRLAGAVVPAFADFCAVDGVAPDGSVHRLVVHHRASEKADVIERLRRDGTVEAVAPLDVRQVLRDAVPELYTHLVPELVERVPPGPLRALVAALGLRSLMLVPIAVRGVVLGALTVATDETSGRHFDADDLAAAHELCARVALAVEQRHAELERERLMTALARSNEELDRFAYITSHDLKAPLRGIASIAGWLEEDLGETLPAESRKQLDLLRGRVRRLDALIDGVLAYSRAGRTRTPLEVVDVKALVEETVELVADGARARFRVGPLPTVRAERVPLQQVVLNLCTNALKHGGDGLVDVRGDVQGGFLRLCVVDHGPGVPEAYRERVWGIFQTLKPRDEVEGAGIGLAVVRKLAEARGGRAWVDETPGGGATFVVVWPSAEGAGEPSVFDTGQIAAFDSSRVGLSRASSFPPADPSKESHP